MVFPAQPELWAKGRGNGGEDPPTVFDHCSDVYEVASSLWDVIEGPLADAVGESVETLRSSIRPLLLASAMLHDVLKANSAFQDMLRGKLRKNHQQQPVRHEILAAVLLMDNRFWGQWFANLLNEKQRWMVAWAVAGHHLQMRRRRDGESSDPMLRTGNVPEKITVYLGNDQVNRILQKTGESLGVESTELPKRADTLFDVLDDSEEGIERAIVRFVRQSDRLWRKWRRDNGLKLNLALLKALLIAADVAGSALPTEFATDAERKEWISERLGRTLDASALNRVYEKNLAGRDAHDFQKKVGKSEYPVTVVVAGCGNGKTTAAYMWAERWASGRKLFFTYPTTGTASAGFKDYLLLQPELHRALIHGRADVDLDSMLESQEDIPAIERAQRLESLNAWGQQAIACTVDTVLGLTQNQRRPLFAFPAIARGAFVFDEVHSYDKGMFSQLLRFLTTFPGLPALIMSASIPAARLEALRTALGERMNSELICGDRKLEEIKRYTLRERTVDECWTEVERLLTEDGAHNAQKVLWVCNTVQSAIAVYREAQSRFSGARVLLYHSRYRYEDRVQLQDQVIDEFDYQDEQKTVRKHQRSAIAITTQVCEMSLDISADLLVTACCPLPSLVQRLGRLNRYAFKDDPWPALVYEFSGRPYQEGDAPEHVKAAMNMVRDLEDRGSDQVTLAEYVNKLQSSERLPENSAWLDGGWQSEPLPAREGSNSITVVRTEDIENLSRPLKPIDVIPLTIPMLFKRGFSWEERAAGYPIAGGEHVIQYCWDDEIKSGVGAFWKS